MYYLDFISKTYILLFLNNRNSIISKDKNKRKIMTIISKDEFLEGIEKYEIHEPRDTVYKITLFYI